ncbi:MAG: outer membrane protein assembly factor BamA, partial [Rhodospirillales bacterium]|nr:outer membrane protein assembly factor BamA [Rhodospirillales bacterium]
MTARAILLIALLLVGIAPASAQQSGGTIREIIIEGSHRIEQSTVRSYLLVREGDPFDPERIDRSLKSLFATGLFADISIDRQAQA